MAEALNKTFNFWMPVELRKAADGEEAAKGPVRIGGFASLSTPDLVKDEVLQEGLDWSYFLEKGFFKWEHPAPGKSSQPEDYVGYPDIVETVTLNGGGKATRVEGYLLSNNEKVNEIVRLAKSLADMPDNSRQLGFSVEGVILEREGSKIPRALVKDVVITAHPMHPDAKLEILARSLAAGFPQPDQSTTTGGAALIPQSIDGGTLAVSTLTYDQAVLRVLKKFPDMTYVSAAAIVDEVAKACGTKE